jgi:hypothetical protein
MTTARDPDSTALRGREMVRKLFIVAKGNTAVYGFLQRTVGQEPQVAILYDRREAPIPPKRLARLLGRARRLFSRSTPQPQASRPVTQERRRHPAIDAEIRSRGWTVIHLDSSF